jgi:hypothetical protein
MARVVVRRSPPPPEALGRRPLCGGCCDGEPLCTVALALCRRPLCSAAEAEAEAEGGRAVEPMGGRALSGAGAGIGIEEGEGSIPNTPCIEEEVAFRWWLAGA